MNSEEAVDSRLPTEICKGLKQDEPKDAAILACLTTAFWGTARLGEVTVKTSNTFDPTVHVKVSDVKYGILDQNNLEMTAIFIPWMKVAREKGEDIFWAKQEGIIDPESALANHIKINKPPPNAHLFTYKYCKSHRPMVHDSFLQRINEIVIEKGLDKRPSHGIRVGSTLEYLLRGVPFQVVKAKGRRQSDAFKLYLRNHAQIMAPYMQAVRATLPSALNVINASSVGKLVQLVTASRLILNHEGRVDPMKDECHYQIKH